MSDLVGAWRNTTEMGGFTVVTTQIIRPDLSYETTMVTTMPDGAAHTVIHRGAVQAGAESFRAVIAEGETGQANSPSPVADFPMRPFNAAEMAQTKAMLDQDVAYTVSGDLLKTRVKGPMGEMDVVYDRVAD